MYKTKVIWKDYGVWEATWDQSLKEMLELVSRISRDEDVSRVFLSEVE